MGVDALCKVIGPMDTDVNQARLLLPGGTSQVDQLRANVKTLPFLVFLGQTGLTVECACIMFQSIMHMFSALKNLCHLYY